MIPFSRMIKYGRVILPQDEFNGNVEPQTYSAMSSRAEMGFCYSSSGDIYAMGGVLSSTYYRDFWKYTASTNTWSQLAQFGTTRSSPAMAFDNDNNVIYSFGGSTSVPAANSMRNDLYKYDVSTNVWSLVSTSGVTPAARLHASMVHYDNKLWLFGSYSTLPAANTLSVFDISTSTWSTLATSPYPMALGTSMVLVGTELLVMGVSGSTEYLMGYDTVSSTWRTILSTTERIGRIAAYKSIVVLFGYSTGNMYTYVPGNVSLEFVGTVPNYLVNCNIFANSSNNFILTMGGKNSSGATTTQAFKLT